MSYRTFQENLLLGVSIASVGVTNDGQGKGEVVILYAIPEQAVCTSICHFVSPSRTPISQLMAPMLLLISPRLSSSESSKAYLQVLPASLRTSLPFPFTLSAFTLS